MGIKAYRQETRLRYRHRHFLSRHGCRVDVIQAVVFEICHASDTSEGSEVGFSSKKTRPEVPINRQMFRSHRLAGTHDIEIAVLITLLRGSAILDCEAPARAITLGCLASCRLVFLPRWLGRSYADQPLLQPLVFEGTLPPIYAILPDEALAQQVRHGDWNGY